MSSDLLSVEASVSIMEVAQRMVERNVGAVLVLDDGRLAGILTERDVLRAVARGLGDATRVADCMTAHPETIAPDDTSTTRCPAARAAAISPQSLTTAVSSISPPAVVTDELPTFTTTFSGAA